MTWRRARFGFFRYNSCHDCVASTFPRLVGQHFPFPGGPRPREPGSPSATASSARATTSPSINCPAQAVLGCVANVLVRQIEELAPSRKKSCKCRETTIWRTTTLSTQRSHFKSPSLRLTFRVVHRVSASPTAFGGPRCRQLLDIVWMTEPLPPFSSC
jgi:hypothetical protein